MRPTDAVMWLVRKQVERFFLGKDVTAALAGGPYGKTTAAMLAAKVLRLAILKLYLNRSGTDISRIGYRQIASLISNIDVKALEKALGDIDSAIQVKAIASMATAEESDKEAKALLHSVDTVKELADAVVSVLYDAIGEMQRCYIAKYCKSLVDRAVVELVKSDAVRSGSFLRILYSFPLYFYALDAYLVLSEEDADKLLDAAGYKVAVVDCSSGAPCELIGKLSSSGSVLPVAECREPEQCPSSPEVLEPPTPPEFGQYMDYMYWSWFKSSLGVISRFRLTETAELKLLEAALVIEDPDYYALFEGNEQIAKLLSAARDALVLGRAELVVSRMTGSERLAGLYALLTRSVISGNCKQTSEIASVILSAGESREELDRVLSDLSEYVGFKCRVSPVQTAAAASKQPEEEHEPLEEEEEEERAADVLGQLFVLLEPVRLDAAGAASRRVDIRFGGDHFGRLYEQYRKLYERRKARWSKSKRAS